MVARMCLQNGHAKSSPEEVISADEALMIYCKPVRLYSIIHHRSHCNRSFLSRNLSYKIANRESGLSTPGMVFFNYKDVNNTVQKTEVREDWSCPFCHAKCGSFKGLELHLNSSHELFEFEFMLSEGQQTVNVSMKLESFGFEEKETGKDKFEPFSFCSKPGKRRESRDKGKRPQVSYLPGLASGTENGIGLLNDGNRGLGYPGTTREVGMTSNSSPATAHSSVGSNGKAMSTSESVGPANVTKAKKLSAERSEARSNLLLQKRQFYHSHRFQPMSLEQVMSGQDSEDEVDDEVADFEDRRMLDDFVDVSTIEKRFMHLWNSFVRKQRVLADGHIPWCCEAFTKFHKKEFLSNSSLCWCWRVLMVKLWNLGLIEAATINKCSLILEEPGNNSDDTNNNNSVDHGIDINKKSTDEDANNNRDE